MVLQRTTGHSRSQRSKRTFLASTLMFGLTALGLVGCSDDGDSATAGTTAAPVLQVTVAEDGFCEQMTQIRVEALQSDGPQDPAVLAEQYREVLPEAPAEIQTELEALIQSLESGDQTLNTEGVESSEVDGDGWQPSADPAVRVFDYVETHCSGIASNPGPAATQPE